MKRPYDIELYADRYEDLRALQAELDQEEERAKAQAVAQEMQRRLNERLRNVGPLRTRLTA